MPQLPSFKGLVEAVLTDLLPPHDACRRGSTEFLAWKAFYNDKYDEALDILESPREGGLESKDVRKAICYHLTKPRTRNLKNHLILARLSDLDRKTGRLVTTNFDDLFERAVRKLRRQEKSRYKSPVYIAPALPPAKPETSCGLIYLHGKLGYSPEDRGLVLTTANFGTAYMLEGWAGRFVVELFRNFHVVFIGYRVEDPTMRYLVSALAAAREESKHFKEAYAFAPYDNNDDNSRTRDDAAQEWLLKGLTPLPYKSSRNHFQLWQELEAWADDHRQGILGRRQKAVRLGQYPPLENDNQAVKELAWALEDEQVAKFFANQTRGDQPNPVWIAHLQEIGLLKLVTTPPTHAPLVAYSLPDSLELNDITFQLGRWIANCLDSQEALDWALSSGGVLHRELRWQIQGVLKNSSYTIPPPLRKIWQVLASDDYAHALSARNMPGYSVRPRLSPNNIFAIRTFLDRLRPIPVFRIFSSYFRKTRQENPNRPSEWCDIDIELVGTTGQHDIDDFIAHAEDWDETLALMADNITSRLSEAMEWLQEFELASPETDLTHVAYRSISPHEQNKHAHTWTILIALARDSLDSLLAIGDKAGATRLTQRWRSISFPVFRRLILYAATKNIEGDIDFAIEIMLKEPHATLWESGTKRETLRFLRKRGKHIPTKILSRLTKAILAGPSREHYRDDLTDEGWNQLRSHQIRLRLHKLLESGRELPKSAMKIYDQIQERFPWQPPGDRSEEFSFFLRSDLVDSDKPGKIENFAAMSAEEFVEWSRTQTGRLWDCGGGWHIFVKAEPKNALNLLKTAADNNFWPTSPWYTALSQFTEAQRLPKTVQGQVAEILLGMPLEVMEELALCAALWLEKTRPKLGKIIRQSLWRRIWEASLSVTPPEDEPDFDMTLNYAGGVLGSVLYNEMADYAPIISPDENPGLPTAIRKDFEKITDGVSFSAVLARARMAPMLFILFRVDSEWTINTFLKRMDLDDEEHFESILWEGFLWNARISEDLFVACKELFFKIISNIDKIPEQVRDNGIQLFIQMAIPPNRNITVAEAKRVLFELSPDNLADAAWALKRILKAAGNKSCELWQKTIGPWFADAWPKLQRSRSKLLSEKLAWMAIDAGDAFPDIVVAIKDFLLPEEWENTLFHLLKEDKKTDLISRFPDATLCLADKIVGEETRLARDTLAKTLTAITGANPGLRNTRMFKRLTLLAQ